MFSKKIDSILDNESKKPSVLKIQRADTDRLVKMLNDDQQEFLITHLRIRYAKTSVFNEIDNQAIIKSMSQSNEEYEMHLYVAKLIEQMTNTMIEQFARYAPIGVLIDAIMQLTSLLNDDLGEFIIDCMVDIIRS